MKTKQEIYDQVKAHLLNQKDVSLMADGQNSCAYRGRDGLRCAVGCLIPDDVYDPSWEGATVHALPVEKFGVEPSDEMLNFLSYLQVVHDLAPPLYWKEKLEKLAEKEGLSP